MADNPLKAIVDAIAEEDNLIGGQLLTRLRESHLHGRNDGEVAAADPDRLVSPVDVFKASDVGHLVDLLEKDTPTGNEGTYVIDNYVDAKNVDLLSLTGGAPGFVNEDPVRWRFASLRVESAYEFPERDHLQRVYVGSEPDPIPYAAIDLTVGAQQLRGLGAHRFSRLGATLEVASPTTLVSREEFFTAADVGKALWILPAVSSTGNEGPRVIATFVDTRTVTFSGANLVADESNARFLVKTYQDEGYLTTLQRELAEVVEASGSYSGIDLLRRSLLIDHAVEEEIDRIARRFGLIRPRSLTNDEIWRKVVMVRAYLAASPVYSIELMLDALYPEGGWAVTEDLSLESLDGRPRHANEVFITTPDLEPGDENEGRTFLTGPEDQTSTTTTSVTVDETPITVISVKLAPIELHVDMDVLPSADSPAWTYQAETTGTEGTFFTVSGIGESWTPEGGVVNANVLQHVADNPGTNSGRYYLTIPELDADKPVRFAIEAAFKPVTATTVGGMPWMIVIEDGEIEYALMWNTGGLALGQSNGTQHVAGGTPTMAVGEWHTVRLERRGDYIYTYRDNAPLFPPEPISTFSAGTSKEISFGYWDNASSQNWTVQWDHPRVWVRSGRDHWNLYREDGALATASDVLSSASNLFASGDTGKHVFLRATNNVNWGLWEATFGSGTTLTLSGISRPAGARVYTGDGSEQFVEITDPLFNVKDIGKDIIISGSGLGNNRTVTVLGMFHERLVEVSNPGADFVEEDELDWELDTNFVLETSIPWELVAAGSSAAKVLTLRDALPATTQPVQVEYTKVLSAELLRNEFIENTRVNPELYYPFYLLDVDEGVRTMIDMVTAAGVIPSFSQPD
jgi:hypothetical protein